MIVSFRDFHLQLFFDGQHQVQAIDGVEFELVAKTAVRLQRGEIRLGAIRPRMATTRSLICCSSMAHLMRV